MGRGTSTNGEKERRPQRRCRAKYPPLVWRVPPPRAQGGGSVAMRGGRASCYRPPPLPHLKPGRIGLKRGHDRGTRGICGHGYVVHGPSQLPVARHHLQGRGGALSTEKGVAIATLPTAHRS